MAEVVFLTEVPDILAYAARLARKKLKESSSERVAVLGPPATLSRLNQWLWSQPVGDFLPHWHHVTGAELPEGIGRTRLWLLDKPLDAACCSTAINLGADLSVCLPFERVAELLPAGNDGASEAGRMRWRAYSAQGWTVRHHKLGH